MDSYIWYWRDPNLQCWGVGRGMLKGPKHEIWLQVYYTINAYLSRRLQNWKHALNDLKRMLSMRLKYKITDIRPEHEKLILFPGSSVIYRYRLELRKNLGDEYLKLGPFKCALIYFCCSETCTWVSSGWPWPTAVSTPSSTTAGTRGRVLYHKKL